MQFNCFSLNSIGPMVEMLTGPRRYLAVYFTSALAGSLMSYRYCASPAVGASGAIFGLVWLPLAFDFSHRNKSNHIVGNPKDHKSLKLVSRNPWYGFLCHTICMNFICTCPGWCLCCLYVEA
jgi:membrane associated rhomboid family serine protease